MEKENSENGKNEESSKRPKGKDVMDIFGRPIPMKWVIVFIVCFLSIYTYFRLSNQ
jgi:hypothetical protein